jgi:hypothetical protein
MIKSGQNHKTAQENCATALDRVFRNLHETDAANRKPQKNAHNGNHLKLLSLLLRCLSNRHAKALNPHPSWMRGTHSGPRVACGMST